MSIHPTTQGAAPASLAEGPRIRRLADKIHDSIAHALNHGRVEIASRLSLICDSMVETEAAQGYASRSEDELKSWLSRRFSNSLSRGRRR